MTAGTACGPLLGFALVALPAGMSYAAEPPPTPLPVPKTEGVEVRLVLVDVLVLDAKGRTVPGLGPEDFVATVDGEKVPVDTLDVDCPEGAADDAAAARFGAPREARAAGGGPRRLVLVVDYPHLSQIDRAQVLDWAKDVVQNRSGPDEEIMVVALDLALRIERTFTADHRQVVRTLDRMMHDITLWEPSFAHLSDQPFFDSLKALLGVLEFTPGRKAVVLFSNLESASREFDDEFAELAACAVDARASIYTVHAAGLETAAFRDERPRADGPPALARIASAAGLQTSTFRDERPQRPGGPPVLARIASATGGRLTRNTNDLSLGYARAQRDLGCRYTLGFYDRDVKLDRLRRVHVAARREGLRVLHAENFVFRSREKKRESLLRAAFVSPESFQNGVVRTHLFLLRPEGRRSWDALLAVGFPVHFEGDDPKAERDFGATIRRGPQIVHAFNRRITLHAAGGGEKSRRQVTFLQPLEVEPGRYEVRAVLSDPGGERPFSTVARFEVPAVPRKRAFLVGPILGGRAGRDVVVRAEAPSDAEPRKRRAVADPASRDRVKTGASFEPLLIQEVAQGDPVFALTQLCGLLSRKESARGKVARSLSSEGGKTMGTFNPVVVELDGSEEVSCRNVLDLIPTDDLEPGRYTIGAVLEGGAPSEDGADHGAARFLLLPAGESD